MLDPITGYDVPISKRIRAALQSMHDILRARSWLRGKIMRHRIFLTYDHRCKLIKETANDKT
jgi:hypothetical protein